MAHACRLVRDGVTADGNWRRDGDELIVTPAAGRPVTIALGEVSAIGGDGFSILMRVPSGELRLERLGADGPTLLQELRRDWPPLRAQKLRLTAGEAPGKVFAGQIAAAGQCGGFRGFFVRDRLLVGIDGADVAAFFLADVETISFDRSDFSVHCIGWSGAQTVFSRLAGETEAFCRNLQVAREQLAVEAEATIAEHLPGLSGGGRAQLAAVWLPGRVLSFAELERLAPGFEAAFTTSWLGHSRRAEEGQALMTGVAAEDRYLAFAPADRTLDPNSSPGTQPQLLWLLVRNGEVWSLELLTQGNYATYLFKGGSEVPNLVAGIVHMPQFSREALYQPLSELVEQRSQYAIAARDLPVLRALRSLFSGRRIHKSNDGQVP
jgi:hypothetical protein